VNTSSNQLVALLTASARNRDNLIFQFDQLDSQLRKIKTDIRKDTLSEQERDADLARYPLKGLLL
jgi:uncharacterized protein (DUF3084 family)